VTEYRPIILIDTREQLPLTFRCESRRETLPVGDYGLESFSDWTCPRFIVERKSLDDLCQSLGRGRRRFMREIEKMRQFSFAAIVIEGVPEQIELAQYRSRIPPTSVFGTLDAIAVRTGIHVCWCGSPDGAARQIESYARQFQGGVERDYLRLIGRIDSKWAKPRKATHHD